MKYIIPIHALCYSKSSLFNCLFSLLFKIVIIELRLSGNYQSHEYMNFIIAFSATLDSILSLSINKMFSDKCPVHLFWLQNFHCVII